MSLLIIDSFLEFFYKYIFDPYSQVYQVMYELYLRV